MRIANPLARIGEDKAAEFLRKQGYKILERNFRKGYGEIDIIAIDHGVLVFIEVKTTNSKFLNTPLENINYFKLKTLTRGAQFYKSIHPELPDALRLDAVSVIVDPNSKSTKIELIRNIHQPSLDNY